MQVKVALQNEVWPLDSPDQFQDLESNTLIQKCFVLWI
jgi:hypothetical protein